MTPEELADITARADAAPSGPWRWEVMDGSNSTDPGYSVPPVVQLLGPDSTVADELAQSGEPGPLLPVEVALWSESEPGAWTRELALGADAPRAAQRRALLDFIAAARTDVPALVAEVTRLDTLLTATLALVPCDCGKPNGEHADACLLGIALRQVRESEAHR